MLKRKTIPIAVAMLLMATATTAQATEPGTLEINDGPERSRVIIVPASEGKSYSIISATPLEISGATCKGPEGPMNAIVCDGTGIDRIEAHGGAGNDTFIGKGVTVPLILHGGPGNDRLRGGAMADLLFGEDGKDLLVSGKGDDRSYGQAGDDLLIGGDENDTLYGGLGNDILQGRDGDDFLYGGPGRDILDGDAGKNTIIGGPGEDVVIKPRIG